MDNAKPISLHLWRGIIKTLDSILGYILVPVLCDYVVYQVPLIYNP